MTPYIAAAALAALPIVALWGLRWRRAYRIAEKRRANAFRLAEVAGAREAHHKAITAEAIRQLRGHYVTHAPIRHNNDLHDIN